MMWVDHTPRCWLQFLFSGRYSLRKMSFYKSHYSVVITSVTFSSCWIESFTSNPSIRSILNFKWSFSWPKCFLHMMIFETVVLRSIWNGFMYHYYPLSLQYVHLQQLIFLINSIHTLVTMNHTYRLLFFFFLFVMVWTSAASINLTLCSFLFYFLGQIPPIYFCGLCTSGVIWL